MAPAATRRRFASSSVGPDGVAGFAAAFAGGYGSAPFSSGDVFHNGWLPFGAPAAFVVGSGDENSGAAPGSFDVPFAGVPVVFHGGGANSCDGFAVPNGEVRAGGLTVASICAAWSSYCCASDVPYATTNASCAMLACCFASWSCRYGSLGSSERRASLPL
ncbi:hypothetical protein BME24068_06480 [Burkholderia metallica]|nr:hypothetical protein BME24068_06480 [Burkholderia metallica]